MKKLEKLYMASGILSILYCISIMLFTGFGSLFFLIWAVIGAGFFFLAGAVSCMEKAAKDFEGNFCCGSCFGLTGICIF